MFEVSVMAVCPSSQVEAVCKAVCNNSLSDLPATQHYARYPTRLITAACCFVAQGQDLGAEAGNLCSLTVSHLSCWSPAR